MSCEAEKALKRVNMFKRHNESCQMVNRWGILAASSAFCRSGGAQMEAMRDPAWVLTHALVNMTNASLSSSFLRTDRAFGSRFGPIAKWPFSNETSFCKEPHFEHVAKTLRFSQSFLESHFVKNGSKIVLASIFPLDSGTRFWLESWHGTHRDTGTCDGGGLQHEIR